MSRGRTADTRSRALLGRGAGRNARRGGTKGKGGLAELQAVRLFALVHRVETALTNVLVCIDKFHHRIVQLRAARAASQTHYRADDRALYPCATTLQLSLCHSRHFATPSICILAPFNSRCGRRATEPLPRTALPLARDQRAAATRCPDVRSVSHPFRRPCEPLPRVPSSLDTETRDPQGHPEPFAWATKPLPKPRHGPTPPTHPNPARHTSADLSGGPRFARGEAGEGSGVGRRGYGGCDVERECFLAERTEVRGRGGAEGFFSTGEGDLLRAVLEDGLGLGGRGR